MASTEAPEVGLGMPAALPMPEDRCSLPLLPGCVPDADGTGGAGRARAEVRTASAG